ncbi:SURF1 family protein [Aeromicrobium wangtongii]|uniref:SURF1-like protein n=1 Tax=Aeromicrobium wangtongii TaxID=2969247 RepID=A0ABY5M6H9_9ACTN|nr:SURF1 family protein [Aeromicrobium wangtongii]MCD9199403.1 SURF1 family protein [Aeromicrobium wangtongii]UUP13759.1 SURF1 family protein [Aeromicrobium wangtongii]
MTARPPLRAWLSPGLLALHALGLVAVVFCVVMGLWQAGAYDDRQHDEQADKRSVPQVQLTELWDPDGPFMKTYNHRPVTFEGQFAPASDQIWVTGKEQDGKDGAWLLAPVQVEGGETMLVLRGWAPETGAFPEVPTGRVQIDAVLEPGEKISGSFDPADRTIGAVRIPSLINELPYDLYSGYAISTVEDLSGGLDLVPPPQPSDVSWTVGLRNLAYAMQWWVFGLFAAFMWWRMCTETLADRNEKVI